VANRADTGRPGRDTPAAELPTGRRVRLPGRGTTYVWDVPGPPGAPTVVLLHGLWATTVLNWSEVLAPLAQHVRVLALDHRGHGRGLRSWRPFTLEDCADDVVALADALDVPEVLPVGYSMGGPVALLARRRHPDRVPGLVLCATSASFGGGRSPASPGEELLGTALRLTPSPVRRLMLTAAVARSRPAGPFGELLVSEAGRHHPAVMLEARRAVRNFDARPWLGSLAAPTAVVVTSLDRMVPPSRQLELARATGASVHRVDAGHDVAMRDPGRFVPVLVEACSAVVRRTGSATQR
jgi:3-oxoadipate enol-lactonase